MSTKSERKSLNRVARSVASASTRSILTSLSKTSGRSRRTTRAKRGRRGRLSRQSFINAGLAPPRRVKFGITKSISVRDTGGVQSRTPVPTNTNFSMKHSEEMYKKVAFTHPTHGVGDVMSFSGQVATISSNGVALNNDFALPIEIATLNDETGTCGVISSDSSHVSGLLVHPAFLTGRLALEAALYGKYRFKWIRFTYQTYVGTGSAGLVYMTLLRNPTRLVESARTPVLPIASKLLDVIPNTLTSRFSVDSVEILRMEDKLYNTDVAPYSNSLSEMFTNNASWIAYLDERIALRFVSLLAGFPAAGAPSTAGILTVDGEIEFYQPIAVGATSIGGEIVTPALLSGGLGKVLHEGKWKYAHDLLSRDRKSSLPTVIGGEETEEEKGVGSDDQPQTASCGLGKLPLSRLTTTLVSSRKHPLH